MNVYLVRHAWAEERGPEWPNDDLRPLTRDGIKRFRDVAKRLVDRGLEAAVIATSPLVRCRQTADILAKALDGAPVVEFAALAPESDLDALLAWTAQQKGNVVWVGHAPDVGELLSGMIGGGAYDFAKGAAAAIEFADEPPAAGAGQLRWLVTAKTLGC